VAGSFLIGEIFGARKFGNSPILKLLKSPVEKVLDEYAFWILEMRIFSNKIFYFALLAKLKAPGFVVCCAALRGERDATRQLRLERGAR
jgi:hypothetical protein